MGMGDQPIPYEPKHYKVRDDVIGKTFASCATRSCPHPGVVKRYGTGGVANVSVWTCRKCRYVTRSKFGELLGCGYELE